MGERSSEQVVSDWVGRGRPLDIPEASTMVWEQGPADAVPVICLHGVPSSAFLYRKVLDELAARGRRGIAFDLPGLGMAERPEGFDYRWSGLGAWTLEAVDSLGLDRFHLLVHDIGGPVGFDVVARAPERIASLTALNTFARVASFRRPWSMEPFARRGIGEAWLAGMTPFAFERLMRLQGVGSAVPAEELRAYVRLLKRVDRGRAFLQIMRGFERTEAFEGRILEALAAGSWPAQVLWGAQDPALKLEAHAESVRAALGAPAVVPLQGKHFVPEDAPAEIAEHVDALIAGSGSSIVAR